MAVALRLAPAAVLAADDDVLDVLIERAGRARTEELWALEVQAATAEMVHALWRVTLMANAKKGTRAPEPLRLPRPWRPEPAPRRVSLLDFARRLGRGS